VILRPLEDQLTDWSETAGLGLVRHASSVIAAATGAVAIGDLSVAAGDTSTHLGDGFKEVVGVTPMRLARTYRFTATVLAIDNAGPSTGPSSPLKPATTTRLTSATTVGRSQGRRRPTASTSGGAPA
jgi:hypothetical protein